jgi:hypothetical protein
MNYQEAIENLAHLLRSGDIPRDLEKRLLDLSRAIDIHFFEADYAALTPRDPDQSHPLDAEYRRIFAPDSDSWSLHY